MRRIRTADKAESRLIDLGVLIGSPHLANFRHVRQAELPEWVGAEVRVTSDPGWGRQDWRDGNELVVQTRHARLLTWLLLEIRDTFDTWLDYSTKEPFFNGLAQAALKHLARVQPEPEDPRPLLKNVLSAAFAAQKLVQRYDALPTGSALQTH